MSNKETEKRIIRSLESDTAPSRAVADAVKEEMEKDFPRRKNNKLKYVIAACVIVVICLAIAVPLAVLLPRDNIDIEYTTLEYPSLGGYFSDNDIPITTLDEIADSGSVAGGGSDTVERGECLIIMSDDSAVSIEESYTLSDGSHITFALLLTDDAEVVSGRYVGYENLEGNALVNNTLVNYSYEPSDRQGRARFDLDGYTFLISFDTVSADIMLGILKLFILLQ